MCCWGSDLCLEDALTHSFGRIRGSMEILHHCGTMEVLGHVNTPDTYSGF